jgi:hypothetical protein
MASASAAAGSAALAVSVSPSSTTIAEGLPTNFVISVTNRGPNVAPAASLQLVLEANPHTVQFNVPTFMRFDRSPNVAIWSMGNLAVGQTVRATITLIGQVRTGSTPDAVRASLILAATSTVTNPLLIHDRAGDVYSLSRSITTVGPVSHNPFGTLDSVTASGRTVRSRGWAADADNLATPLPIALSNNGARSGGFRLPVARPDVAHARGTGPKQGFDITVTLPAGRHTICAYAINTGAGRNTVIGCKTVVTH